jgi:hypothetical protein
MNARSTAGVMCLIFKLKTVLPYPDIRTARRKNLNHIKYLRQQLSLDARIQLA